MELIRDCILSYYNLLPVPRWDWPKDEFKLASYQRWATMEAFFAISDHPFDDCECVLRELVLIFWAYRYEIDDEQHMMIFQTAMDTVEDIINYLKEKELL